MAKRRRKGKQPPEQPPATAPATSPGAEPPEQDAPQPDAPAPAAAAAAPSSLGGRRASNAFILLFLLYQVAMPLRYYLGGRGDDERFSWRMFSTVRMHRCDVRLYQVEAGQRRPVDLTRAVQVAWIGMLERNRPQVVRALMRRRCREPDTNAVRFERRCTNTDGTALPPLLLDMSCQSGRVTRAKAAP